MHSTGEDASSSLYSNRANSRWPGKHAALPQQRFAIRIAAISVAVASDVFLLFAANLTATYIRFGNISGSTMSDMLVVVVLAFLLAGVALEGYRLNILKRPVQSVVRMLFALAIATGFAFAAAFAFQAGAVYSRLETGYMLVAAAVYLIAARFVYKAFLDRLSDVIDPCVLVLGPAPEAKNPRSTIDRMIPPQPPDLADPVALERTYAEIRHADRIILAIGEKTERAAWARYVRMIGIEAEIIEPDLQDIAVLGMSHWQGAPTLIVARAALNFGERALKRAFDLLVGGVLLLVTAPMLLALMVLIKHGSPGPAIFAQWRVGRNNNRYRCYKLRTMYDDMQDLHGEHSAERDDVRITRIGKFLRRTSLDEFPQLWNVVRGDMSLVGPRPHALGSVAAGSLFWEAVPNYWSRHAMRPGMTGLAQVRGLRGATRTRLDLERRVAADLEYINGWSIWLDIKILLQTARVLLHREAY